MILKTSGQNLYRKLIGKTESEAQHRMRCYPITNTNQYLKRKTIN